MPPSPDREVEDFSSRPPHVARHFDQLLLQGVCVLGQLVQADGPVAPPRIQLSLHRLWEDGAKGVRGWCGSVGAQSDAQLK